MTRSHSLVPGASASNPSECKSPVFMIGVCGGTASGKTSVCDRIVNYLSGTRVVVLSLDNFYKGLGPDVSAENYNFDHPDAFDYDLFYSCLEKLSQGYQVDIPIYSFITHSRCNETLTISTSPVIIVEGILVFHDQRCRDLFNMKLFVDTDADLRLLRRIKRDISERGRTYESVLQMYEMFVKPSFDEFIAPSKKYADVIIPHWPNEVAVTLISENIKAKIGRCDLDRVYSNLKIMPHNSQCRQLHTIIRNIETKRTDFVFYIDRISRLVVEYGLGFLPFRETEVITPTNERYMGIQGPERFDSVCAVSLVRAGEVMEAALMSVCKNIRIGKILLRFPGTNCQWKTDQDHVETKPQLMYVKLPLDIKDKFVLLLDPVVGRGCSVIEVIRLLKERGVPERNIVLLNILASADGVKAVCSTYPEIQFVTTEVDRYINSDGFVVPGLGDVADRYFGTEKPNTLTGPASNLDVTPRLSNLLLESTPKILPSSVKRDSQ
eukprot:GHVR01192465.1.p1 GENE.GHVR01192465.1~~GHVR01192465.1.p1  ORF type:complete len:494 (-),score=78.25 GHVR01192465.1:232-1713(-)